MIRAWFLTLLTAVPQAETAKPVYASFTDAEIHLYRDFFRPGGGNPPPSVTKKESLSPALARQIKRGGTLPEEIKGGKLPDDLAKQLPPAPKDYQRVLFHRWVLLVQDHSRLIVDLVDLIPAP